MKKKNPKIIKEEKKKCSFCPKRGELFTHFRNTNTGYRVFGVCADCTDKLGSHTNNLDCINGYTYTERFLESHPALKDHEERRRIKLGNI